MKKELMLLLLLFSALAGKAADNQPLPTMTVPPSVDYMEPNAWDGSKYIIFQDSPNPIRFHIGWAGTIVYPPSRNEPDGWAEYSYATGLEKLYLGRDIPYEYNSGFDTQTPFLYSNLKSVTFGPEVANISAIAFKDVFIPEIVVLNETPPSFYSTFSSTIYQHSYLYVPAQSLNKYKSTYPWSSFLRILPIDVEEYTSIENVGTDSISESEEGSVMYYDLNGRIVDASQLSHGIYLRRSGKTVTKEIR